MNLESRCRNWGFWASLIAFILLVLKLYGVSALVDVHPVVNLILLILVFLGILNNPTTKCCSYCDDK